MAEVPIKSYSNYHALSSDEDKDDNTVKIPESKSILSHQGLQIIFKNIQFSVKTSTAKVKDQEKQILKNLQACFNASRLTGILGASGSGKTSLLNLVAGQLSGLPNSAQISGEVVVNGETMYVTDSSSLKEFSGYVQQDDVILDTMTVREAITMAALLRLPKTMSKKDKLHRVEEVIQLLHLQKCADGFIGSAMVKGISGGERRRVSIAMVMITNPSVLYLDEPTSGLDAFTAFSIMKTLKGVVATGRTIAATIHQPSSNILNLIDDLLILSEGNIIYYGPTKEMVSYFASLGFQCPQYTNPADYLFMEILNDANVDEENKDVISVDLQKRLNTLTAKWPLSSAYKEYVEGTANKTATGGVQKSDVLGKAPFFQQFQLLGMRALRNAMRHKLMVRGRLAQSIVLALICGLIFLQVTDDQKGIQDRQGSLFFISTNGVMGAAMGVLAIFAAEKAVFLREYSNGMYDLSAYFLSRTFVEIPFKIVLPIIASSIMYWMVGFQAVAGKFVIMMISLILIENAGGALGVFVASFFEELAVALAVLPIFLMPLMIFSGLIINTNSIPVFLDWIKYLSPMKYSFVILSKNEFAGLELHCTPDQLVYLPGVPEPQCPITSGEQVIKNLGFEDQGSIAFNLWMLVIMYGALTALAFFALWRQIRKKSSRFS